MSFKGIMKGIWTGVKVAAPIIAPVAAILGVPMLGTIMNAIISAENAGGTGPQKLAVALQSLSVAAPLIIDQLERSLGVDIPEEAAAAFVKAQTEAVVQLMNATGLLPKGKQ